MVVGAAQSEDGGIDPCGLELLADKADVDKGLQKFIPKEINWSVLDFSYRDSEYPVLKGKNFQVMLVEHDPKYLPFLSLSDGDGVRRSAIYVRRGTSSTEATHQDLQKLINKRLETGYSTQPTLNLTEHLEQLKVLDKERPKQISSSNKIGEWLLNAFDTRSPDYKAFLEDLYSRKKRLIEQDLGLH